MGSTHTTRSHYTITLDGPDATGKPIYMVRLNGEPYTRAFSLSEARHLLRRYEPKKGRPAMGSILITRDIDLPVLDWGQASTLKVSTGRILNGPLEVTEEGNALIGLAYDEPVVVPAGAFEVIE